MLLAINNLDTTIRISFRGLRPSRLVEHNIPRFDKIDYFKFKSIELDLPEQKAQHKVYDQIEKNFNILKVYNPNFKGLLSRRATMEYDFKKNLAKQRRAEFLEQKKKHAQENLNKFIKRRERDLMIVSHIMKRSIKMVQTTTWMKSLTTLMILLQIKDRFENLKEEKHRQKVLNQKASFIGLMFRAKLNKRHKDHIKYSDLETCKK